MKIPFFVFPFLSILTFTNSGDTAVHNRRTLHQPDSSAAPLPPSSSNLPFTPNPTTAVSPPRYPPVANTSASFLVIIPSINLPNSPITKSVLSKLIPTAVTLAIAFGTVAAIVVYFRIRKRRRCDHDVNNNGKTHGSDHSSRVGISCNGNNGGEGDSDFQKFDSLELCTLPPLNKVSGDKGQSESNVRNNSYENGEVESSRNEEFERMIGLDSWSCLSSRSGSIYPARSMSLSILSQGSLSLIKSPPDIVAIQNAPQPPPQLPAHVESLPRILDSSSEQSSPLPARIPPLAPPPPPKKGETRPKAPTPTIQENLENPKPKLKRLYWDKVRASSDRETVWDQLKWSSFELNEEMIETLFIINPSNSNRASSTNHPIPPWLENRVLDPKKSQNIAISLKALNVTIEEVCEALLEGNADALGTELLESLVKMAPTKEEEWKLKEYRGDSRAKLGPAEKFLKAVLDVPFAFKRVDAMLYVSNFNSEVEYLNRSFRTLEAACEELRNSRMFLKLLEAVLKTGNRMNVGTTRGDAQAFKLDTLLKLIDVKGTDGKTTLLHFVVQEIIKGEGARLSTQDTTLVSDTKCPKLGLQLVASISSQLSNVKKAAAIDSDVLNSDVVKLSKGISNISQVVRLNDTILDRQRFSESMNKFMKTAIEEVIRVQTQESVVFSLVKEVTEYFHGNSAKEEAHPFRIFIVVRDFLNVLDRVCKEVGSTSTDEGIAIGSGHKSQFR